MHKISVLLLLVTSTLCSAGHLLIRTALPAVFNQLAGRTNSYKIASGSLPGHGLFGYQVQDRNISGIPRDISVADFAQRVKKDLDKADKEYLAYVGHRQHTKHEFDEDLERKKHLSRQELKIKMIEQEKIKWQEERFQMVDSVLRYGRQSGRISEAVRFQDHEVLDFLLSEGVNPNQDVGRCSWYDHCLQNQDYVALEKLLVAGAIIEEYDMQLDCFYAFKVPFHVLKLLIEYRSTTNDPGIAVTKLVRLSEKTRRFGRWRRSVEVGEMSCDAFHYELNRAKRDDPCLQAIIDSPEVAKKEVLKKIMLLIQAGVDPDPSLPWVDADFHGSILHLIDTKEFGDIVVYLRSEKVLQAQHASRTEKESARLTIEALMAKYGISQEDIQIRYKRAEKERGFAPERVSYRRNEPILL